MSRLPYFTLLRVVFGAFSEAHAIRTAQHFEARIEEFLEPADEVTILQTAPYGHYEQPEQEVATLLAARNILLRLHHSDCHATAQFLDRIAWNLKEGHVEVDSGTYDWNRIAHVTEQILKGYNPLD